MMKGLKTRHILNDFIKAAIHNFVLLFQLFDLSAATLPEEAKCVTSAGILVFFSA